MQMKGKRRIAAAMLLALGTACAVPAAAQDVLMRRPLPRTTPATQNPATPDPNGNLPDETPPDPIAVCDGQAGSPQPIITNAAWVETGWRSTGTDAGNSCTNRTMTYICQATFACQVNGANDSFTSDAPDSTCENFDGQVSYPPRGSSGPGPVDPCIANPFLPGCGLNLPPAY